jgi:hypothetical protein
MKLFTAREALWGPRIRTAQLPLRVTIIDETPPPAKQYDEQGREVVFRFTASQAPTYVVDRDRIFDFIKRRRKAVSRRWTNAGLRFIETSQPLLPDASVRKYLRSQRNAADFFADVRDLQTHSEVELY